MTRLSALLRAPLLHFVLLGGLLFAAQRPEAGVADAAPPARSDEQLLVEEALRLELDRSDPVVRDRLLRNLRFALRDDARSDAELLAEAQRLGMAARDAVVRRRLAQLMEIRLTQEVTPTTAELEAFVAAAPERYTRPQRFVVRQLFFSRDLRADPLADAAVALANLQRGETAAADPFLLGEATGAVALEDLRRRFGDPFAWIVAAAPPQQWMGPVRSTYGEHLLRVEATEFGSALDLDDVRAQATYAWRHERRQQQLRAAIAGLRQRSAG